MGTPVHRGVSGINDFEIRTLDDVGMALEAVQQGDMVTLVVVSIRERQAFIVAQSSMVQVKAQ